MKARLLISVLFAICISSVAFSQTNKGNWIVSGSSSLQVISTNPEGGESSTTVTLSPSVGYFVANGLSIGANVNLLSRKGYTTFSILPTASYYLKTNSPVHPYFQLGVGYSSISYESVSKGGLALGSGIGAMYLLNKLVGVNLGVQYTRSNYDGAVNNTFGGVIGFSVFF